MWVVEAKLLFFVHKKHEENGKSTGKTQGKHRDFGINWSVATLNVCDSVCPIRMSEPMCYQKVLLRENTRSIPPVPNHGKRAYPVLVLAEGGGQDAVWRYPVLVLSGRGLGRGGGTLSWFWLGNPLFPMNRQTN